MTRRIYAALLVLVATVATALSAPPDAPKTIQVEPGEITEVSVKVPTGAEIGFSLVGKAAFREVKSDDPTVRVYWFHTTKQGTYTVVWWTKGETTSVRTVLQVGAPAPAPAPPAPGPTPAPAPTPSADAPIPGPGFRVLVVYDPLKLTTLTEAQKGAIFAQDVRDYLNKTCPIGPDGTKAEWRMWPSNVDTSQESKLWQDAYKRPRTGDFWVIVSNGKTGFEGVLPQTKDDMLALLKKYGDAK